MHTENLATSYLYKSLEAPMFAARELAPIAMTFLATFGLIGLLFWAVR